MKIRTLIVLFIFILPIKAEESKEENKVILPPPPGPYISKTVLSIEKPKSEQKSQNNVEK